MFKAFFVALVSSMMSLLPVTFADTGARPTLYQFVSEENLKNGSVTEADIEKLLEDDAKSEKLMVEEIALNPRIPDLKDNLDFVADSGKHFRKQELQYGPRGTLDWVYKVLKEGPAWKPFIAVSAEFLESPFYIYTNETEQLPYGVSNKCQVENETFMLDTIREFYALSPRISGVFRATKEDGKYGAPMALYVQPMKRDIQNLKMAGYLLEGGNPKDRSNRYMLMDLNGTLTFKSKTVKISYRSRAEREPLEYTPDYSGISGEVMKLYQIKTSATPEPEMIFMGDDGCSVIVQQPLSFVIAVNPEHSPVVGSENVFNPDSPDIFTHARMPIFDWMKVKYAAAVLKPLSPQEAKKSAPPLSKGTAQQQALKAKGQKKLDATLEAIRKKEDRKKERQEKRADNKKARQEARAAAERAEKQALVDAAKKKFEEEHGFKPQE